MLKLDNLSSVPYDVRPVWSHDDFDELCPDHVLPGQVPLADLLRKRITFRACPVRPMVNDDRAALRNDWLPASPTHSDEAGSGTLRNAVDIR